MAGTQAFWIDAGHEGTQARYGEHLRRWRHAFAAAEGEPAAGGVTLDPLHFALGAWEVATRPMAESPYVRCHPRVLDATCHRPEEAPGPLAVVELAAPAPVRLPGGWSGWQRQGAGEPGYAAPPYERRTALSTLELRVPLAGERLPTPTRARAEGLPNLDDAQASLEALVGELNAVVTPFLRQMDGPEAPAGDGGELPEWLRTQIAADRAIAETAGARAWRYQLDDSGHRLDFGEGRGVEAIGFHDGDLLQPVEAIHIALHDPADAIARCEAELMLLDEHTPTGAARRCPACAEETAAPCGTLRRLAYGYRLRPGWRDEWRP
ncbi:hypothetical protein ITP53_08155 [Nonomuraea sp. K274]|uniref:Uncharacterized protein n=1 Tax=Nonomuraea cypriaca TaxID=1187855 RepID=A0A931A3R2_9ACTN|nr:DUF6221 family protein [Nonomuraea cypriaca]MBF8185711.1 hypothetical protein [Nonomuraea cypriaca]